MLDEYDDRIAFGEFAEVPERIGDYVGEPDLLHTAYTFDFLEDRTLSPSVFQSYYQDIIAKNGDPWPCVTFSNHDVTRPVTRWGGTRGDEPLAKFGLALLLALRGTVLLYQGEELGLPDVDLAQDEIRDPVGDLYYPFGKGRDGCRTPMPWIERAPQAAFTSGEPWLPIPDYHASRAVDVQEATRGSVLKFAREAISFRKSEPLLQAGEIDFHDAPDALLVFSRTMGEDEILCAFNTSATDVIWSDGLGLEIMEGKYSMCEFGTGHCVVGDGRISLGARSAAFFKPA